MSISRKAHLYMTPPPAYALYFQWLLVARRLVPKFLGMAGKESSMAFSAPPPTMPTMLRVFLIHSCLNISQLLLEKSCLPCMAQLKHASSMKPFWSLSSSMLPLAPLEPPFKHHPQFPLCSIHFFTRRHFGEL